MNGKKVEEVQRAIGTLTQEELEELRLWLDEYAGPSPLDRRIETDLATGRLDKARVPQVRSLNLGFGVPLPPPSRCHPEPAAAAGIYFSLLEAIS